MNKRLIIQSFMISALVVALMSTTVFASSTSKTDTGIGRYGSYAEAYVKAYYTVPGSYTSEEYKASRDSGSASNDGAFYFCFFIDEQYYQGTEGSDSKLWSSGIDCSLAATYISADFIMGVEEWTCTALADV
jgi:hypothetical protein